MRYSFYNTRCQQTVELPLPRLAAGEVAPRLMLAAQLLAWSARWEESDDVLICGEAGDYVFTSGHIAICDDLTEWVNTDCGEEMRATDPRSYRC